MLTGSKVFDFKTDEKLQAFVWEKKWTISDDKKWKWLGFCMIGQFESCEFTHIKDTDHGTFNVAKLLPRVDGRSKYT